MRQASMSKGELGALAKLVPAGVLAAILCATITPGAQGAAGDEAIPDLSSADLAWVKVGDDFIPFASGPRPVTFDKAHPYQPNNDLGLQPTYRVAESHQDRTDRRSGVRRESWQHVQRQNPSDADGGQAGLLSPMGVSL